MYTIHHTEAIVIGVRDSGEADRILLCHTRDLGLVSAHSRSLRRLSSKLRYALIPFSRAEIDLVRGTHGWLLTSARALLPWSDIRRVPEKRRIAANYFGLFRRLVSGEEFRRELFDEMHDALTLLNRETRPGAYRDAEMLIVARLLEELGYWGADDPELHRDKAIPWDDELLERLRNARAGYYAGINRAFKETQL